MAEQRSVQWGPGFDGCFCLVGFLDGNFSEAFALCFSPGCFLPISLQAGREPRNTVFLSRRGYLLLLWLAPKSSLWRTDEDNAFSRVWGFVLVVFPWLVSSVTRTALCTAGFTVVTSASCAASPMQRWEFLQVSDLQTFLIMHPYLQKNFWAGTSNVCVYSYL